MVVLSKIIIVYYSRTNNLWSIGSGDKDLAILFIGS